jgi:multimeric flavodoxin WrbA
MNLLAIMGSPRKGKATDTLLDRAVEGAVHSNPGLSVQKVILADHNLRYCTNCLVCRDRQTDATSDTAPTVLPAGTDKQTSLFPVAP